LILPIVAVSSGGRTDVAFAALTCYLICWDTFFEQLSKEEHAPVGARLTEDETAFQRTAV
jgi:hypothetical protein